MTYFLKLIFINIIWLIENYGRITTSIRQSIHCRANKSSKESNIFWCQPVSDMLQLLICGSIWNKKPFSIANCYSSHNTSSTNWTVDDRNNISYFTFHHTWITKNQFISPRKKDTLHFLRFILIESSCKSNIQMFHHYGIQKMQHTSHHQKNSSYVSECNFIFYIPEEMPAFRTGWHSLVITSSTNVK